MLPASVYYHRLLRRTRQGLERYSPFHSRTSSKGGTALGCKPLRTLREKMLRITERTRVRRNKSI